MRPDLAGCHVLVVDDEAMVRFVLTSELEDAGCVVTEAGDGTAALAVIQGPGRVDLLVTDIRMPGIDGWTLADRSRELRPSLPVLYVTGWSDEEARPVPGSVVLAKPFTPKQFVAAAAALIASGPAV